jgi:uncharacterized metal-binding protein YceD (DUF177 family)
MSAEGRLHIADAGIRLDSMPTDGRDLALVVGDQERAEIAEFLEISAIDALSVKLRAVRFRGGMRVTGRLEAQVVQPSVVSLEPVTQKIAEPIDRIFLPAGEKHFADDADADVFVDPEGEDIPDHFEGNEADLTDLIVETVALALDPYPRLPGESVKAVLGDEVAEEHPFAALKALKTRDDGA